VCIYVLNISYLISHHNIADTGTDLHLADLGSDQTYFLRKHKILRISVEKPTSLYIVINEQKKV
jgi:hypothetical protein